MVLDTNVLSETGRPRPNPLVVAWLATQSISNLYFCDVTVMEQTFGAELFRLRSGSLKYMRSLEEAITAFGDRILPFDRQSAIESGRLRAQRQSIGRAISTQDAMIAAICLSNGATLATRNTKDFEGLDLRLINPFEGA